MDELIWSSACSLARAIKAKHVSSTEVVQAHLQRIGQVNPQLNAVFQINEDRVLAEARAADKAFGLGESMGPLHGVPMTMKDSFDTADIVTTGGVKARSGFVPEHDATVVNRLRRTGAILLGKTNTPELTLGCVTDNFVYGRTSNPYDPKRSTAGSSGGAAAIIAAGGSPLDLGSDTGGSIRLPAHYCGIVGIKPTSGRVPRTGHTISFDVGPNEALTQIGPMARFVEDLVLTLPLISGPDWQDPAIVPMEMRDAGQVDLKALRVAFYTDNGIKRPTPETIAAVRSAASALADADMSITEERPAPVKEADDLLYGLLTADGGETVRTLLASFGTEDMHPAIAWTQERAALSRSQYGRLLARWTVYRSRMLAFMEHFDLLLCPTSASPALPHEDEQGPDFSYTQAFNLAGWPAVVVPAGSSPEGLPIGVQIVAHPWREDVALAAAARVEAALGGWQRPGI